MDRTEELMGGSKERKNRLVVVRAGDASLHPSWMVPEGERSWDLVVSYYGDDPSLFKEPGVLRVDRKGTEYPAFHALFTDPSFDWSGYRHIWLPDDDLAIEGRDIDHFFEVCERRELDLAQPSLTPESHYSYPFTLQDARYELRFTNFVEVMAPCFSARALRICLDTFAASQSSYGLDLVWPRRIGNGRNVGIVDAVSMTHTRPVGGPLYGLLASMGIDPRSECRALLAKEGAEGHFPQVLGGIRRDGKVVSFDVFRSDWGNVLRLMTKREWTAAWALRMKMRGDGPRSWKIKLLDQMFWLAGCDERWKLAPVPEAGGSTRG
ncbi:MAG TPA: DUF707 domain-containing protein [Fibrobacteria bacterium]|nr:DUF707 domain-containing protein [Fibrobacteria bacterium]